jgi:hypothetical protein
MSQLGHWLPFGIGRRRSRCTPDSCRPAAARKSAAPGHLQTSRLNLRNYVQTIGREGVPTSLYV